MPKNKQLNSTAIGVGVLGAVLFIIGLIMFGSVFASAFKGFGSSTFPNSPPSMPNPLVAFIGALLAAGGGFLVKLAIGMGLVANAKPIARWVGDVTGQGSSRYGQAFRSGPTERSAPKIQIRCQNCQGLNTEGARFCNQCGKEL